MLTQAHPVRYAAGMNSYLQVLCEKHGIGTEALATAAGVTRQAAHWWRTGKRMPSALYLRRIVRVFKRYEAGLTVDSFLAREEVGTPAKAKPRR